MRLKFGRRSSGTIMRQFPHTISTIFHVFGFDVHKVIRSLFNGIVNLTLFTAAFTFDVFRETSMQLIEWKKHNTESISITWKWVTVMQTSFGMHRKATKFSKSYFNSYPTLTGGLNPETIKAACVNITKA